MIRLTGEFTRKLGSETSPEMPGNAAVQDSGFGLNEMPGEIAAQSVFGLLLHANKEDEGYRYTFNGDLVQMSLQETHLKLRGFDIGHLDVYPAVKTEGEFKQAITEIFKSRVPGWWLYKDRIIKQGLCTEFEWASLV